MSVYQNAKVQGEPETQFRFAIVYLKSSSSTNQTGQTNTDDRLIGNAIVQIFGFDRLIDLLAGDHIQICFAPDVYPVAAIKNNIRPHSRLVFSRFFIQQRKMGRIVHGSRDAQTHTSNPKLNFEVEK